MIIIYTKDAATGQLTRNAVNMGKKMHIEHYAQPEITSVEQIVGWPETKIEWHGNVGYGVK